MKQYKTTKEGDLLKDGVLTPKNPKNRHYQGILREVEEGSAEIIPYEHNLVEDALDKIRRLHNSKLYEGTFTVEGVVGEFPMTKESRQMLTGLKATLDAMTSEGFESTIEWKKPKVTITPENYPQIVLALANKTQEIFDAREADEGLLAQGEYSLPNLNAI